MKIEIQKNISLKDYSSFKIGGLADYFVIVHSEDNLREALEWAKKNKQKIFILGGGTNTLFSDDNFAGLVIKNEIKGIEVLGENETTVILRSYGGEIWSKLVNFAVSHNYYGLENLFFIPGTVGAAPVQNIGAYGVELKDIFYNLAAINIKNGKLEYFNLKDCDFSYRHSIFKGSLKGQYFILYLDLKLSKQESFNLSYRGIKDKLLEKGIERPSLKELTDAIQEIRNSKLPNPANLANAGSFFKNPVISQEDFAILQKKFPEIKGFPDINGFKIAAAWLIESCGFKQRDFSPVGVYEKQALIIVNYGGAKQKDVLNLVSQIKAEVRDKFGIQLEEEVNIL